MGVVLDSYRSEWLKRRRSAATLLVWSGAFFIPLVILIGRLTNIPALAAANASPQVWQSLFGHAWQFMGLFLLPMGVILATSLVTQLEYRNNTWKQVHVTPQPLSLIFWTKLAVIVIMLLQFFVLFNAGIYLSGVLPALFVHGVQYPAQSLPVLAFLKENGLFLLDCLPIVAGQYLLSLQFRNFLIPLGVGMGLYVASMMALLWQKGYIVPYAYCALNVQGAHAAARGSVNFHWWALGYFLVLTIVGYILYLGKKDKS